MKSFKIFFWFSMIAIFFVLLLTERSVFVRVYDDFRAIVSSFTDRAFDYKRLADLKEENESLKLKITTLESSLPQPHGEYINADVYSRYPFNDREIITINKGRKDGIKEGMTVLTKEELLLGKVIKLMNSQSEVETIFDPAWRSSVALGPNRVQAVLNGGKTLTLGLIPAEEKIEEGYEVFNISSGYPLYQLIGRISVVRYEAGTLWQNGEIGLPYDVGSITGVLVVTDFP